MVIGKYFFTESLEIFLVLLVAENLSLLGRKLAFLFMADMRDVVRRIGEDQVGLYRSQQFFDVFDFGRVSAHETVFAELVYFAVFRLRLFYFLILFLDRLFFLFRFVKHPAVQKIADFNLIETGDRQIEIGMIEFYHQLGQFLVVPISTLGDFVECQTQGFFLFFVQIHQIDIFLRDSFPPELFENHDRHIPADYEVFPAFMRVNRYQAAQAESLDRPFQCVDVRLLHFPRIIRRMLQV